jgi:hypothetical protein
MKRNSDGTISIMKGKETAESIKIIKKIVPEYSLNHIEPYVMDRQANNAESKVYHDSEDIKVVKELLPPAVIVQQSAERIIQKTAMKPAKSANQEKHEASNRKHVLTSI